VNGSISTSHFLINRLDGRCCLSLVYFCIQINQRNLRLLSPFSLIHFNHCYFTTFLHINGSHLGFLWGDLDFLLKMSFLISIVFFSIGGGDNYLFILPRLKPYFILFWEFILLFISSIQLCINFYLSVIFSHI